MRIKIKIELMLLLFADARVNVESKLFCVRTGMEVEVLVTKLCPTLCDPMDWSLPGSSICEILQVRILECHSLLQGIFPIQGLNLGSTLQVDSLPSEPPNQEFPFSYFINMYLREFGIVIIAMRKLGHGICEMRTPEPFTRSSETFTHSFFYRTN